ncbi:GNAT family N-acetyltransferase [Brevibacillus agri]|uniref:GNAT family N-acetyltransferase n=1 Tax=Brevibacillus agri TaxID=51101 RepID=UPI0024BFC38D|nr:GNAT family N-acetyltransferase [Brevibacillus agri]MED4570774.1 GNAT family N-acetyltransferase [Brevibacillus agri]WHX32203.1 GNAT family N-acetyltransferase [Brevibacillus agri]
MDEIRPVSRNDIDEVVRIAAMAYPGSNLLGTESRQQFAERVKSTLENDPNVSYHGCYRDGRLVGIMKWYDLSMYVYGIPLLTGGIGTVAVDLLHKKEKVAKAMLHGFLSAYRERGIPIVSLYPFRVDFYKQMGFGAGSKIHQYKFKPASLPYTGKEQIVYLKKEDKEQVLACYQRVARQTHGMIRRTERDIDSLLNVPEKVVVGVQKEGKLTGYIAFQFESAHAENKIYNNLVVKELLYESRESLAQLLSFLHSQADQIQRIVLTTPDEDFHLLLSDPGNGTDRLLPSVYHESHVSGVGLMYRVIDVPGFFRQLAEHRFGAETISLRLTVRDSFLPENEGTWLVQFQHGQAHVARDGQADVSVELDISDFSSLVMGVVRFSKLYEYGMVELDDTAFLPQLDRLFSSAQKPQSMTAF